MPKAILSAKFVREVHCPHGQRKVDYFDLEVPGFLLEVRRSGGKTFYQRYREQRGRERQYKIGSAAILTLGQARKKAKAVCAEALLGGSPQQDRSDLRSIPRLSEFVRESYLPFATNSKKSWRTDETILRLHILPKIGCLSLDEVTNVPIGELLQSLRAKGYSSGTTNRVLILLRFIFNLARKWGIAIGDNPTAGT